MIWDERVKQGLYLSSLWLIPVRDLGSPPLCIGLCELVCVRGRDEV